MMIIYGLMTVKRKIPNTVRGTVIGGPPDCLALPFFHFLPSFQRTPFFQSPSYFSNSALLFNLRLSFRSPYYFSNLRLTIQLIALFFPFPFLSNFRIALKVRVRVTTVNICTYTIALY